MSDVNWWLMVIAFLLGLVLTLLLMVRRAKREVPVYGSLGRGPGRGGAAASGGADVDEGATARFTGPKHEMPDVDAPAAGKLSGVAAAGAVGAGGAALVGGAAGKEEEPYGAGSIRVAASADAPTGYTIKGNEDSMLYHTHESPAYKQTIAEVWFRDEPSAQRAGFTRWDKGRAGAATFADIPPGPHGPGSAKPAADGSGPAGWTVKGNEDSMLYHSPESPAYAVTVAEVWFRDVETAEKAGFSRWDSGSSQREQK